jgi:hypothetical protein
MLVVEFYLILGVGKKGFVYIMIYHKLIISLRQW